MLPITITPRDLDAVEDALVESDLLYPGAEVVEQMWALAASKAALDAENGELMRGEIRQAIHCRVVLALAALQGGEL